MTDIDTDYLVVGAGISGLSFATSIRHEHEKRGLPVPSVTVVEKDSEPGGYCKTIEQDGFVWDYSGHFFHFRHADVEKWLRDRMPNEEVRKVTKRSFIRFGGVDVDFPFQKNIHQLPREDFIQCLHDLVLRDEADNEGSGFAAMVRRRFGRGIAERFLIPYNEKLYACDLNDLDEDAMGRFFPHADINDIVRNMVDADNTSYNATFTYPAGGAMSYVRAFLRELPDDVVNCGECVEQIDLNRRVAKTSSREISYRQLISSAPLPQLLERSGLDYDRPAMSWNKVLVFNLGFDKKGRTGTHWMYFPERDVRFYRVGFYDNILDTDRMSLYVEIGAAKDEELDVEAERQRVLEDLRKVGIVDDHRLVSWHTVTMNPAYVHITQRSLDEYKRVDEIMRAQGVYSVGRYGRWTYCSIEDNILETRELAGVFGAALDTSA